MPRGVGEQVVQHLHDAPPGGVAEVQADKLVSNFGQTTSPGTESVHAQPFTTGSDSNGYEVTSVQVDRGNATAAIDVRIVPSKTSGEPDLSNDSQIIKFTAPSTFTANAVNTFTAPADTILARETTYHVLVTGTASLTASPGSMRVASTNDEDADGATGWSIGNDSYHRAAGDTNFSTTTNKLKIAVTGFSSTTNTAPEVANEIENQVATVGVPFTFAFPENTFSDPGDTLTYTTTKTDDTALPGWLTFDADGRTFTGTPTASSLPRREARPAAQRRSGPARSRKRPPPEHPPDRRTAGRDSDKCDVNLVCNILHFAWV